jgi:hypothetical protein
MNRLVPGTAAGALALGLFVAVGAPAQAGGLRTCNDYVKARNISCTKASAVVEEGLHRLLDKNAKVVRFDGWTCKRRDRDDRSFRCAKKANGTTMVVKYTST